MLQAAAQHAGEDQVKAAEAAGRLIVRQFVCIAAELPASQGL
jgi:hypothetical protein